MTVSPFGVEPFPPSPTIPDPRFRAPAATSSGAVPTPAESLGRALMENRGRFELRELWNSEKMLSVYLLLAALAAARGDVGELESLAERADAALAHAPRRAAAARQGIESTTAGDGQARARALSGLRGNVSRLARMARQLADQAERAARASGDAAAMARTGRLKERVGRAAAAAERMAGIDTAYLEVVV